MCMHVSAGDVCCVVSYDTTMGYVMLPDGSTLAQYDSVCGYETDSVLLTAQAKPGFKFEGWSDQNTDNPRTVSFGDYLEKLAPMFSEIPTYCADIWVEGYGGMIISEDGDTLAYTSNSTYGADVKSLCRYEGDSAVIKVITFDNYRMNGWQDGSMNTTRTIYFGSDMDSYGVSFDTIMEFCMPVSYDQKAGSLVDNAGNVYNSGDSICGLNTDSITLRFVANRGYEFSYWFDQSTDSVITIAYDMYDVNVYTDSIEAICIYPSVKGMGYVLTADGDTLARPNYNPMPTCGYEGETVTLTAVPASGYAFKGWMGAFDSDNMTSATITLPYGQAADVVAVFDSIMEFCMPVSYDQKAGSLVDNAGNVYDPGDSICGLNTDSITLRFVANRGYEFSYWFDQSTDSVITIAYEQLEINVHTDSLNQVCVYPYISDAVGGIILSAEGDTLAQPDYNPMPLCGYAGEEVTFVAVPSSNYKFSGWQTLSTTSEITETSATITLTLSEDMSINAVFDSIVTECISVSVFPDSSYGYVISSTGELGNGEQVCGLSGDSLTLTAVAKDGFVFAGWSNQSSSETIRLVYGDEDGFIYAMFAPDSVVVNAVASKDGLGTVEGSGTYAIGDTVMLVAHAGRTSAFKQWSDGETSNVRTVVVTKNLPTFEAEFVEISNTQTVSSELSDCTPSVDGSTEWNLVSTTEMVATLALDGFVDSLHLDYLALNSYVDVVVTDDEEQTMYFAFFADSTMKEYLGSYSVSYVDGYPQLEKLSNNPLDWIVYASDPTTKTLESSLVIPAGSKFMAIGLQNTKATSVAELSNSFSNLSMNLGILTFDLDVESNDETLGSVTGKGEYLGGDTVRIEATPTEGNVFIKWSDGDTNASRVVSVTDDMLYTAYFGVETSVETVANAADGLVNVYTASGVLVRANVEAADAVKGLKKGVYVVGNKKVVVLTDAE